MNTYRKVFLLLVSLADWILAICIVLFYKQNPLLTVIFFTSLYSTVTKVLNSVLGDTDENRPHRLCKFLYLNIENCPPVYKYIEISSEAAISIAIIYAFIKNGILIDHSTENVILAILVIYTVGVLTFLIIKQRPIGNKRDVICEQLESFQPMISDFKKSDAYKEVLSVVEQIGDDFTATEIESLKSDMRKQMLSICTFLKENAPSLSKDDIDYCLFALLGLKQVEMLKFFNVSYSTLRSRKNRIKEKMNEELYKIIFQE